MKADQTDIPVGGSVTLSCSVEGSYGWNYYWYQHDKDTLIMQDGVQYSTGPISVSEGGVYWCRAGRGEPVYYTEYSDELNIGILGELFKNRCSIMLKSNSNQDHSIDSEIF